MSHKAMSIAVVGLLLVGLVAGYVVLKGRRPQVLIIGVDGVDWKVVDRLIADGRLPNLERLKESGAYGPLMTLSDIPLSPVIWTSIATGKTPAKHNITWFFVNTPKGGRTPVRSHNRKAKALWNILAENQRDAGVVGWWATAPAERVGDGVIISDALGYHGFGATGRGMLDSLKTYPPELHERYQPRIPPLQQIDYSRAERFFHMSAREYYERSYSPGRALKPNPANPIHLFQEYTATMEGYTDIACDLLERQDFDAFMVYFEATDSISHLFMKYAAPRQSWIREEDFARYKDVVDNYYVYADEKIGRLLEKVDDDWLVLVVSDHGFRTGERRPRSVKTVDIRGAHLDHEPLGIFIARGPNIRAGQVLEGASVLDVTPTVLHYLGLDVATDMDGRVLKEIFEPEFLAAHPLRYVATYESPSGSPHAAPAPSGDGEVADPDALAALRTLGYAGRSASEPGAETLSSPEQHNNLGRIHLGNGDAAGALREFRLALKLDPKSAEAHTNIGLVYMAQNRLGDALRAFTRALEANPNDPSTIQNLADLKLRSRNLADAETLYRQAIAIEGRLPRPYIGLGDVLQRLGKYREAEKVLKHAVELDPAALEGHFNLGIVYIQLKEFDKAEEASSKALEINPNHSMTLNSLGHIAAAKNDLAVAQDYFERAAAVDPRHAESRYNIGSIFLRKGKPEEAVPWFEEAIQRNTQLEAAHFNLALALIQSNRVKDATDRLGVLVRLFPRSARGWVQLARIAAAGQKDAEVRQYLQSAVGAGGEAVHKQILADPTFQPFQPGIWLAPPR